MTVTQKFFLEVLDSFIKKQPTPVIPRDVDWDAFKKLARIHSVAGMVGHALSKEQLAPPEIREGFKKKAFSTVMVSSAHIALGNKVIERFAKEGIIPAPFKGAVIRNFYPVPELRTFSDIDILVPIERFEDAHSIMTDMGFEHTDGVVGVRGYNKDGFNFEIHTTLAGDMSELTKGEEAFFALAPEKLTVSPEKVSAEFEKEYHFAYCVWHLTKHLSSSGAGVRMFMDIAVLMLSGEIDNWPLVEEYLNMLDIKQSAKSILFLCNLWFATSIPESMKTDFDPATESAIQEYVITAGTFGFSARSTGSSRFRIEIAEGTDAAKAKRNIIRKMFFPDAEYMSKQYPWYSGSVWLLPFMWIFRLLHLVFSRAGKSLKVLGDVASGGEKEINEARILKKTGWDIYNKK